MIYIIIIIAFCSTSAAVPFSTVLNVLGMQCIMVFKCSISKVRLIKNFLLRVRVRVTVVTEDIFSSITSRVIFLYDLILTI